MEIERKFLLDKLPFDLAGFQCKRIRQAYISFDPTIRLRDSDGEYFLTIKRGHEMAHEEYEFSLTCEQYEALMKKSEPRAIVKTRYMIPIYGELLAELDIYDGEFSGLITVEVEFESVCAANEFIPPGWFGRDVTNEKRYKNSFLAMNGMENNYNLST